jgi:FkbM family methyltransferase
MVWRGFGAGVSEPRPARFLTTGSYNTNAATAHSQSMKSISTSNLRKLAKVGIVGLLGRECKPRRIIRGLAAGYRICVSPSEHLAYLLGTAEPHLQRIIKEYVNVGDVVYDIGANIGYVSLSLARRVGASGSVVAFEPVPQTIALLRRNLQINGITNIQALEIAASDRRGKATMRVTENSSTASLIWHRNDPSANEVQIETISIDELVESGRLSTPSFVKIDVEGAEDKVLLGLRRTLAAGGPVLFVECSDAGRETAWHLLRELGYDCESAMTRHRVDDLKEYRHSDFLWLPPRRTPTE